MYNTLAELPLPNFIDASCDDNYTGLVRSGEYSIEELRLHWLDISERFNEALGDAEGKLRASLLRDITTLAIDIELVHNICDVFVTIIKPSLVKKLNRILRTKYKFEDRAGDILRARNATKLLQLKIDLKKDRYDALTAGAAAQANGGKPTREYYQHMLMVLSVSNKFILNERMLSTYEYICLIKDHKEKMRRQTNG